MKVLKSWLKDYVDISLSDEELSDKLNLSGTAVDAIIKQIDPKVIVAQIRKIEPHPNADRLQIAKVFTGIEELQIVCGAPNIQENQKVPLALVGAKLQDFEIKPVEIRGVESFGMMCSERELGLSEEHSGIKILSEDWEIGKSINEYLTGDTVLDIEITPNRGDCLSHYGVAREIAAVTNVTLGQHNKIDENKLDDNIDLKIVDLNLCSQYTAIKIKNVKVSESPKWLKERLAAMGAKSINNIVDVTNYIMLDLGQPLHAFDAKKIVEGIVIRRAIDGEKIITLDGIERKLEENNLVIADHKKAIAIAGIMGGANSEVEANTTDLILEAAEFNAANIRFSSKKLSLSTEASYRFERGIDRNLVKYAAQKAAKMITEIAGGQIFSIKTSAKDYQPKIIKLESLKINQLLGINIDEKQMIEILNNLGFTFKNGAVTVPSWRNDVALWQDLAEEIGRIYGYANIPKNKIESDNLLQNEEYFIKENLKNLLLDYGFDETINYIFLSAFDVEIADLAKSDLLEVQNPMQKENKFLRNSLIPGLIKNAAKNPAFDPIFLFEIGKVFGAKEETNIGILTSGKNAKSKMQNILEKLEIIEQPTEVNKDLLNRFKIRKAQTFVFEFSLTSLLTKLKNMVGNEAPQSLKNVFSYKKISKYPPLVRDFAFVVNQKQKNSQIEKEILTSSNQVLLVELFDEFTSTSFGEGNKSVAYHVYFQDLNKALNDSEAEKLTENIIKLIEKKFNAKLRV